MVEKHEKGINFLKYTFPPENLTGTGVKKHVPRAVSNWPDGRYIGVCLVRVRKEAKRNRARAKRNFADFVSLP